MTLRSARQHGDETQGRQQDRWQGWQREQRDDLTLSEVGHLLWGRRALVISCALLFLAAALLYGLAREPAYTAEATLSMRPDGGGGTVGNFDEDPSRLRDSAAMSGLTEEAARRAGWEAGANDFNERLEWEQVNNQEAKVRFTASTPEEAARAANAYAETFAQRVKKLQGRPAGGVVGMMVEVRDAAQPPDRPSGPNMFLLALAAGTAGLLVGGIGALVLESRARRWRGSKDAELTLRAPVLGVIPYSPADPLEDVSFHDGDTR
ncbi:MAG TPA: Wzz/FepE/Etk N-terminal domain-containing protein [Rubrobacteraceae bacterium]|nr:Wzz/FepE/Etk N-terminal domain-containing protein [Rubrobacteraceae bacterium]